MNNINNVILSGLMNLQVIKGDTNMEWISPSRDIKINITRQDINNIYVNDNQARYIIKFDIMTPLNVPIVSFKINEFDMIRLLDSITAFLYEFDGCPGSSIYVSFYPSDCTMKIPVIEMVRETGQVLMANNIQENYSLDELRDIKFSLYMQDNFSKVKIFNIFMSDGELDNLAFEMYFYTLIDIITNPQQNRDIDNILARMYGEYLYGE